MNKFVYKDHKRRKILSHIEKKNFVKPEENIQHSIQNIPEVKENTTRQDCGN